MTCVAGIGASHTEMLSLTIDRDRLQGLSMDGHVTVIGACDLPAYLLMHVALTQLRAIRREALALGWSLVHERTVAFHGKLLIVVRRRLHIVTIELEPRRSPISVGIHITVESLGRVAAGHHAPPVITWEVLPGTSLRAKLQILFSHLE